MPRQSLCKLKPILARLAPFVFAAAAQPQITIPSPPPARSTIEIHADQPPEGKIARTIFGSFLEPIGNSINGGLWAEILQNPSLEDGLWSAAHIAEMLRDEPALATASELGLPLPWEPLDARLGRRFVPLRGDAANSWESLEIMGAAHESSGIRQKVYLPMQRTLRYSGSLYAKHLAGGSSISVSLRRRDSKNILAGATLQAEADSWTKYDFTLNLPAGSLRRLEPADFVVEVVPGERVAVDQISLMPADAIHGLDPDVVAMAKAMHVSILRFGGNFTSGYNWKDGVGPRDRRVSMLNTSWGIPEYNTFGTDDFLRFCDLIGAEPQIDLNMGSGTPELAAEWVRYIKAHHPGPVVWELGNELYGAWQTGGRSIDEIARETRAFSVAVHHADPDGQTIATGQTPDNFRAWNAAQLSNPPGTFDDLSTHFIKTTNAVQLPGADPDFQAAASFAMPVQVGRDLQQMQAQINTYPSFADKTHLAVTEWLFASRGAIPHTFNDTAPGFTNMGGAILAAGFLNMLMRNSAIAPIDDMTGILEFAGIWKRREQVYGTPASYAFALYAGADAATLLKVDAASGSYSIRKGIPGVADIDDVPYLDVVAALNTDRSTLTLFCVNRSLTDALETSIRLDGFRPSSPARVTTLRADSIYEVNDEIAPEHIVPAVSAFPFDSPESLYTFPAASVTVIALHRR